MAIGEPRPIDLESRDVAMMRLALDQAREALASGEVPVGAIVVRDGRMIARAHNLREILGDPTAHAERIALTLAGRALGSWRLDRCTIYATLEPCSMCAGAIVQSRIERLVYGAADPKAGACRSLYRLADDPRLGHCVRLTTGVLEGECGALLTGFFEQRRPASSKNHPRRGA